MADAHDHGHDHGTLHFQRTETEEGVVQALQAMHPALAEALVLARRYGELNAEEKEKLIALSGDVDASKEWTAGYHAPGDRCGGCGEPTSPLFRDVFDEGALEYGAFISDVPVHARPECMVAYRAAHPRASPQALDRVRREHMKDRTRPSARMAQFFRGDLFRHPPFGLEDWANSVAEANQGRLDKGTMRDIERLMHWVHHRLFHGH